VAGASIHPRGQTRISDDFGSLDHYLADIASRQASWCTGILAEIRLGLYSTRACRICAMRYISIGP